MDSLEDSVEFATNPDPRCACVLLLDTSGSMGGAPITALNEGLRAFQTDIQEDALARRRVEIAVVTFGGQVEVVQDFVTGGQFTAPQLRASGGTPMGAALSQAVDMIRDRKDSYRAHGIAYYRPWILAITDGEPTDDWRAAAARIHDEETHNGLAFFAVGVDGANMATLEQIAVRKPVTLTGLRFTELFVWLSRSQRQVSASRPGEQVALPPAGWAAV